MLCRPSKHECYMRKHVIMSPVWVSTLLATIAFAHGPVAGQTLKTVKERGALVCGIGNGLLGFSTANEEGRWTGFDVDLCRAVAAAIFNDASKVSFVPLDNKDRFAALQAGKIDLLARNAS